MRGQVFDLSDQVFWYATRAAGLLCWFAACGSVIVGLMMSSRALGRKPTLPWLTDLHRFFGAMAMVFLAVHMVTLWADDFISFGWRDLFVPGTAAGPGLSPLALTLGVVAAWIMALVEATSLVRKWLPKKLWHGIHLASYAVVVMTTVHGWQVGSDVTNVVLVAAGTSTLAALGLLTVLRVLRRLSDRKYLYDLQLDDEVDQPEPSRY
jgi:methionine sulfoxide reductase heme-binding subunit